MAPGNIKEEELETSKNKSSPFVADSLANDAIVKINPKTTWINERSEPEFIRDVCPYFAPTLCNIGVFGCLIVTGKPILGAWCMFVGTPIYNWFLYQDD
jgi:hypothetical protein